MSHIFFGAALNILKLRACTGRLFENIRSTSIVSSSITLFLAYVIRTGIFSEIGYLRLAHMARNRFACTSSLRLLTCVNLRTIAISSGNVDEANRWIKEAIGIEQNNVNVWNIWGNILLHQVSNHLEYSRMLILYRLMIEIRFHSDSHLWNVLCIS